MDPRARTLLSYADISDSTPPSPPLPPAPLRYDNRAPPAPPPASLTYDDDPSPPAKKARFSPPSSSAVPTAFSGRANGHPKPKKENHRGKKHQEMKRPLTHEEIWDDSALVNAWEAAMEEYRAMNGRGWSAEGEGSALWYNTQPEPVAEPDEEEEDEEETYVPNRLLTPAPAPAPVSDPDPLTSAPPPFALPTSSSASPSTPEEALQLALQSWYWAGYYMGRRDEMLKGSSGQAHGEGGKEVEEEEEAELVVTELVEEIVTERMD